MLDWKTATEDEKLAVVRPLAEKGASAGEMSKHFRNATRNATLSFCIRRKIRLGGSAASGGKQVHGNKGQPKVNAIVSRASAARSLPPGPVHLDDETDVGVDISKRVGLLDLTNHTCRWPVGPESGSKQLFCGCYATVETGPYCSVHSARAGIGYGRGPRP